MPIRTVLAIIVCTILADSSAKLSRFVAPPNNDGGMYFYRDDDASNGLVTEYTGDPESDFKDKTDIPRLVEFYSPSCGACRTFKSKYLALASELQSTDVKFYAVSCNAHPEECRSWDVFGYPALLAFPAGLDATERKNKIDVSLPTIESVENVRRLLGLTENRGAETGGTQLTNASSITKYRDIADKAGNKKKGSLASEPKEQFLADTDSARNRKDIKASNTREAKNVMDGVTSKAEELDAGKSQFIGQEPKRGSSLPAMEQNLRHDSYDASTIVSQGNDETRVSSAQPNENLRERVESNKLELDRGKKVATLRPNNTARSNVAVVSNLDPNGKEKKSTNSLPATESNLHRKSDNDYDDTDYHNNHPEINPLDATKQLMQIESVKNANRDMNKRKDKNAKKREKMDKTGTPEKTEGIENRRQGRQEEFKKKVVAEGDSNIGLLKQTPKFRERLIKRIPIAKRKFRKTVEEELLSDVALSFVDGLRQGVFATNLPLDVRRKKALQNWLELLSVSLPPESGIHVIVDDLTANIDFVSEKHANLMNVLDRHPLAITEWSLSCSRGEVGVGFTCGFWKLLHLISVGLAEMRGGSEISDTVRSISPMKAASILREYMAMFFRCAPCRSHFLAQYDECRFRLCPHLSSQPESTSQTFWIQFPLWLWEVHNDVSIRVFNERKDTASKTTKRQMDNTDEIKVLFPSMEQCYECFKQDGTWSEENVYEYLVKRYWNHADKSSKEGAFWAKYDALLGSSVNKTNITSAMLVFGTMVVIWFLWARRNCSHMIRPTNARKLNRYRTIGRPKKLRSA